MSILTVKNVSHNFGGREIFENVSFRLLKGDHVGLVGANGEGKSTFMNIVTDKLLPDSGEIEWARRVRIGYLDQHTVLTKGMSIRDCLRQAFAYLFEAEADMNRMYDLMGTDITEAEMNDYLEKTADIQDMLEHNDFYLIDAKVEEVARGIGLADIGLDRDVHDLSGGQRTKILLAKLLLQKPDVLLLDEPTNYLDDEHITWLKRYLQNYENAFILISHDIPFLNDTVGLIYHVENASLTRYVGNYEEFQRLYKQSKQQLEAAFERQQEVIADLQDFVARNKARVATSNMAKARQKKLDKMEIITLAKEKPKPEFRFMQARAPEKYLIEMNDLVIGYDEPLSKPISKVIERGQKIALIGSNGMGKTTLLKSFLGEIPSISGRTTKGGNLFVGYFEQEPKTMSKATCIEDVWGEFPSYNQREVRRALAKCGLTTEQLESKVYVLSGGEQAKVRLCKILNRETNFLVLDEPTNHLDPEAKDELKRALIEYKGTIIMVCHEPEFYAEIATDVWDCKQFTLKVE